MSTHTRRIEFQGAFGDRLVARLELPTGRLLAVALFAHCFTCTKDLKAIVRISRSLAQQGIGVCRFDFTGLGESSGDFSRTNFSSNLEDLRAAAAFLGRELTGPDLLIGHSLGGAAVLAVASAIDSVRAVATLAAPSDTSHLGKKLLRLAPELSEVDSATVRIAGREFSIRRQLVDDLSEQRMSRAIAGLQRPLLVLHSPDDEVVGIDHAERILRIAPYPKSFVSLDGADHLLSTNPEDARFAASMLASWATRYTARGSAPELEQGAKPSDRRVKVVGGPSGYVTHITSRGHRLVADEPESAGGSDQGPDPYALLLAGLGACKAITMRMYADRKGWPLSGSQLELRHSRTHAEDCDGEAASGRVDCIEVDLELLGRLSPEQRRRLLDIANRCPVHRTFSSAVNIVSRAV